jgi:hypothetical protein
VRSQADVDRLGVPDPHDDLGYVCDAVRLIKRELGGRVPLIGFAGSPWTLATYMIEGGGGDHDFKRAKSWVYGETKALHQLLEVVTTSVISYLKAQREAGVDALMVFDTWGGALSDAAYHEFSLEYLRRVVAGLHRTWEGQTIPGALQFDTLVDDAALAQDLMALRPNLSALFCTDFERQRWVVNHAGAQIEVALDQGRIHVPGTDLSEPLLELELELLQHEHQRSKGEQCLNQRLTLPFAYWKQY